MRKMQTTYGAVFVRVKAVRVGNFRFFYSRQVEGAGVDCPGLLFS